MIRMGKMLVLGLATVVVCGSSVWASWAYVAPELSTLQAEAIVVGKMTDVDKAAGTGTIVVSRVLKGDPKLQKAPARFSAMPPGGMRHSAMMTYPEGREGVWLLLASKKDENGAYRLNYPGLYRRTQDITRVQAEISLADRLAWSKPVGGLSAATLVHNPRHAKFRLLYFLVKNVSDKAVRIPILRGDDQARIVIESPDGTKKVLVNNKGKVEDRFAKAMYFPELPPGQVSCLRWQMGVNSGTMDKPGVYTITMSYKNTFDGRNLKMGNVWTGTIAPPPLRYDASVAVPMVDACAAALKAVAERLPEGRREFGPKPIRGAEVKGGAWQIEIVASPEQGIRGAKVTVDAATGEVKQVQVIRNP